MNLQFFSFAIITYLVGAIPFGLLIVKLFKGEDVRKKGSGNIGATNVARNYGLKLGLLAFICDMLKGFLPVFLFPMLMTNSSVSIEALKVIFAGLAIIGHIFPIYLKFKGGKGVATGAGVFFGISPLGVVFSLIVWVILMFGFRYVSLASLVAVGTIILFIGLQTFAFSKLSILANLSFNTIYPFIFVLILGSLIIIRHFSNIKRLIKGNENRF